MRPWALLAATLVAGFALVGSAGAGATYVDPAGDSGTAPDVTRVTLTDDASGRLVFRVATPNRAARLRADEQLQLYLDTDANPDTGDPAAEGAEYLIALGSGAPAAFSRWNGVVYADADADSLDAAFAGGARISIARRDLGNTRRLRFWIRTLQGDDESDGHVDDAPNQGTWGFALRPAEPVTVKIFEISIFPVPPIAGDDLRARVQVKLSDGRTVRPTRLTCALALAGRAIAARVAGDTCRTKLPFTATGKTLSIRVGMTYLRTTAAKTVRYRVR